MEQWRIFRGKEGLVDWIGIGCVGGIAVDDIALGGMEC